MDGGSHRGALLRSLLDPVMGSIADYQLPSAAAPFVLSQHSDKGLLPQSCSQRLSLVWRSRSIWFMSISGLHQRAVHWPGWIFLRTGLWTNTLPTQSFLWEWLELYHGLKALHAYFWFHGCHLLLSWSWGRHVHRFLKLAARHHIPAIKLLQVKVYFFIRYIT